MLIVCEGRETEPNYFRGLKQDYRSFVVDVKKGKGKSPRRIVRRTAELKRSVAGKPEEYDEVWCVIDVEGRDRRDVLQDALKNAEDEGIRVCLSNPCFEVWLLAHFIRTGSQFDGCDKVIRSLKREWRKTIEQDYDKTDYSIYERISAQTDSAIENARWAHETHHGAGKIENCNSSTSVYQLVEHLLGTGNS